MFEKGQREVRDANLSQLRKGQKQTSPLFIRGGVPWIGN